MSLDNQLDGWCYYPDRPKERAVIQILVNGIAVRAYKAARLRTDLRDLGFGDGYYGFLLPLPSDPTGEGKGIVEVRERRFGQLIGRVSRGDPYAQRLRRLESEKAALDSLRHRVNAAAAQVPATFATSIGELGGSLLHRGYHATRRPEGAHDLHLVACLNALAAIPAFDLSWHDTPKVSCILSVTSKIDVAELAALLCEAFFALRHHDVEFIIADNAVASLLPLLPTRLKHLVVLQPRAAPSVGAGLNAAALAARGRWLAFAEPQRFGAGEIARICETTSDGIAYFGASASLATSSAAPPLHVHGLHCLIERSVFAEAGGCDPTLGTMAMWSDLAEKAASLGNQLVLWDAPRIPHVNAAIEAYFG